MYWILYMRRMTMLKKPNILPGVVSKTNRTCCRHQQGGLCVWIFVSFFVEVIFCSVRQYLAFVQYRNGRDKYFISIDLMLNEIHIVAHNKAQRSKHCKKKRTHCFCVLLKQIYCNQILQPFFSGPRRNQIKHVKQFEMTTEWV